MLDGEGASVPVSLSRIATIPTPSMSLPLGRVERSADSHVRLTPLGSRYVFLGGRGGVRVDVLGGKGEMAYMTSFVQTASSPDCIFDGTVSVAVLFISPRTGNRRQHTSGAVERTLDRSSDMVSWKWSGYHTLNCCNGGGEDK